MVRASSLPWGQQERKGRLSRCLILVLDKEQACSPKWGNIKWLDLLGLSCGARCFLCHSLGGLRERTEVLDNSQLPLDGEMEGFGSGCGPECGFVKVAQYCGDGSNINT